MHACTQAALVAVSQSRCSPPLHFVDYPTTQETYCGLWSPDVKDSMQAVAAIYRQFHEQLKQICPARSLCWLPEQIMT